MDTRTEDTGTTLVNCPARLLAESYLRRGRMRARGPSDNQKPPDLPAGPGHRALHGAGGAAALKALPEHLVEELV